MSHQPIRFDRNCASDTDSVQTGFLSLHKIFHSMQRPMETKSGLEYSTAKIIKIYQVPIQCNRTVMIRTYYFGSYSDTFENQEYDILDRNCAGNTDSVQTGFLSLHKHYPLDAATHGNQKWVRTCYRKIIEINRVPIQCNRQLIFRTIYFGPLLYTP